MIRHNNIIFILTPCSHQGHQQFWSFVGRPIACMVIDYVISRHGAYPQSYIRCLWAYLAWCAKCGSESTAFSKVKVGFLNADWSLRNIRLSFSLTGNVGDGRSVSASMKIITYALHPVRGANVVAHHIVNLIMIVRGRVYFCRWCWCDIEEESHSNRNDDPSKTCG